MKKIIIILILLSIISVIGCSYEQINEQEQIIQGLEKEVKNSKAEIKNLKKEKDIAVGDIFIKAQEMMHRYDQEKAYCKECLNHIEGAVHYFNVNYYTKSEAIREIQDGIDCMRSILGY